MSGVLFRHIVSFGGLEVSEYSLYIKNFQESAFFFFFLLLEEYGFTVAQEFLQFQLFIGAIYAVNAILACSLCLTALPDVSVLFLVMSYQISHKTE